MIALCASHINCSYRIDSLYRQIESLLAQTIKFQHIYVSISGIDKVKDFDGVTFILHTTQLSQFEHYSVLASHLINYSDEYCLLCDDDDFCNPKRNEVYLNNINTHDVIFCKYGTLSLGIQDDKTPTDFTIKELTKNGQISEYNREYFMFCTKIKYLIYFCHIAKDILNINGCDLIWRNFMIFKCTHVFTPEHWLYEHSSWTKLDSNTVKLGLDLSEILVLWNTYKNKLLNYNEV